MVSILLAMLALVWVARSHYHLQTIPMDGYSPIEMVYRVITPQNFARDFPSGVQNYLNSSFSHVYLLAYRLGVNPETMLPIVMALEIFLLTLAFYLIIRSLGLKSSFLLLLLVAMIFISSGAKNMDLGRVHNYLAGKVNNAAEFFRYCAIAAALTGRMALAGLLLGLDFTINPIYACTTAVFVGSLNLVKPKLASWAHVVGAAALFIGVSALWFAWLYQSNSLSSGSIPTKVWFEISRLCSFHWFPIDIGIFTGLHARHFMPLLSFSVLVFFYLPGLDHLLAKRLMAGFVALFALSAFGIVASEMELHPSFAKMQLFRADEIFIGMGLVVVAHGLLREMATQTPLRGALAFGMVLSPFLLPTGFPPLYTLLLVGPRLWRLRRDWALANCLSTTLLLIMIALSAIYATTGFIATWQQSQAYLGDWSLAYTSFGALIFLSWWKRIPQQKYMANVATLVLVACIAWGGYIWLDHSQPSPQTLALNADYKVAQEWARHNTPPSALFMVDPSICYGWRDYSRRSSFGNIREWLYNWANANDYDLYREGMKRARELGINYKDYLHYRPSVEGYLAIYRDVGKNYHRLSDRQLLGLAHRHGIDYALFQRGNTPVRTSAGLKPVFQNDHFIMYQVQPQAR